MALFLKTLSRLLSPDCVCLALFLSAAGSLALDLQILAWVLAIAGFAATVVALVYPGVVVWILRALAVESRRVRHRGLRIRL